MSLKTIKRKSIFLILTGWSEGIIYHVRLEKQLLLTKDLHKKSRCGLETEILPDFTRVDTKFFVKKATGQVIHQYRAIASA